MISAPLITAADAISSLGSAIFLDVRAGPDAVEAYENAHLPGAIRVDVESNLSTLADAAAGGRHPLQLSTSGLRVSEAGA